MSLVRTLYLVGLAALAVGASAFVYQRFADGERPVARSSERPAPPAVAARPPMATASHAVTTGAARELPADAAFTILVRSFPLPLDAAAPDVVSTTEWLEASGFRVFYAEVDLGSHGRWQRVLAGAYTDSQAARRDADRLKAAAPQSGAHLVSAGFAIGLAPREADTDLRLSGTEP